MLHLHARNQADTQQIAAVIAGLVRQRDLIVLVGEMGSGKTFFTQAFGRALNITEPITSPTFNLLHSYTSGRLHLHHADLYRLDRTGELADLGLHELLDIGGVVIVEWGDVVGDALGDALVVRLRNSDDLSKIDERLIDVGDRGGQWDTRWIVLRDSLDAWGK
ncbi:MAG: tRNA (adenosine(37)-N6)-threonylcarbamoyltransferase complex ATPase subunit type 1 TsaE [Ilumatobacteraceae bacterium]